MEASSKEPVCNAEAAGNTGSIRGLGSSPGGGHGNPLQCSCLGNFMNRRVWWATVVLLLLVKLSVTYFLDLFRRRVFLVSAFT